MTATFSMSHWLNSLWPSDVIRQCRRCSTLVQVMAWCHQAPSHYLNQWWLVIWTISNVPQWHLNQNITIFIKKIYLKISSAKCHPSYLIPLCHPLFHHPVVPPPGTHHEELLSLPVSYPILTVESLSSHTIASHNVPEVITLNPVSSVHVLPWYPCVSNTASCIIHHCHAASLDAAMQHMQPALPSILVADNSLVHQAATRETLQWCHARERLLWWWNLTPGQLGLQQGAMLRPVIKMSLHIHRSTHPDTDNCTYNSKNETCQFQLSNSWPISELL